MEVLKGISVHQGISIGKIYVWKAENCTAEKKEITDPASELVRFSEAKEKAAAELGCLYEKTLKEAGKASAMIFLAHQMLLEDEDFFNPIKNMIVSDRVNAEYAVMIQGEVYADIFSKMEDDSMKARSADILDVSGRVIRILMDKEDGRITFPEPVILLAEDLSPSETIRMDKGKVLSFVTKNGSVNSHTAILARTLNLTSLINMEIEDIGKYEGKLAVVDGYEGKLYIDPDEITLQEKKKKRENYLLTQNSLRSLVGKENVTKDGRKILLYANIAGPDDIENALYNDAQGIGLFRSEFLYLGRKDFPTEEEQYESYKLAAQKMKGKKVIIRTLDIGADKRADYFNLKKEENPALGCRAIRICLSRPEIFKTQLRAILRASVYGNIAVMFPMIISVQEVKETKKIMEEVKQELKEEKTVFKDIETGIMIETPAAALISDLLAKEVDFFSIGTNDLTQYTLAADRQNQRLDQFIDPHHPAILRLIEMTVENAHKAGIQVGICGELGADEEMTEYFINLKVDELSVSPSGILRLRNIIRQI